MIKFLRKFENCDIKIALVNSILITKSINLQLFTLILYGVGGRCDRRQFSVQSPFIDKSMILYTPHRIVVRQVIRTLQKQQVTILRVERMKTLVQLVEQNTRSCPLLWYKKCVTLSTHNNRRHRQQFTAHDTIMTENIICCISKRYRSNPYEHK